MTYLSKDNDHFLNDTHQLFKTFYYLWDFRNVPPSYAFVEVAYSDSQPRAFSFFSCKT